MDPNQNGSSGQTSGLNRYENMGKKSYLEPS